MHGVLSVVFEEGRHDSQLEWHICKQQVIQSQIIYNMQTYGGKK